MKENFIIVVQKLKSKEEKIIDNNLSARVMSKMKMREI